MFEVLINENLADTEQLVIDYGELNIATPDELNYGPIHLGSGAGKLLTLRTNFTKIKGYTICNYREVVGDVGSTECAPLDVGQYSLDPFQTASTMCKKDQSDYLKTQKLAFICKLERKSVNYTMFVLYGLLSVSIIFCIGATIAFFKNRYKRNAQQEILHNMMAPRRIIDPAERARLAEEQKKLRIERL